VNNIRKTGFLIQWSLVFCFFVTGCTEKKEVNSVSIQWEGDKAVAFIIPQQFLSSISKDSIKELLHVRLANSDQSIIGDYSFREYNVIFKPIIAFTRGLKYNIYIRNKLIDEIQIQAGNLKAPEIVAVYPAIDTLPENLLKFYIKFSKPMQEGEVFKHIHLIKGENDTLTSVFLEQELWNNESTMLTVWLDPGRIKRDLQPNKLLGSPLKEGSQYQLVIDKGWQDSDGVLLKENFTKNFFAGYRDIFSPYEKLWMINTPKAGGKDQLVIDFNEALDHVLAENTLSVTDINGNEVKGKFSVNDHGTIVNFIPGIEWKQGVYTLQIESRLEDLAGNNLDRLFDSDITLQQNSSKSIHTRKFEVK